MEVRKANINDHKDIVEFQLAMAFETEDLKLDEQTVQNGVNAVLNDAAKGCYYVAEVEGRVVGSLLTTFEWSDWRNGTILWIQSVFVRPEFRRKGIYRSIYSHIQNKVKNDNSLNGIRLYADKTNVKAQKVYENLGMTQEHYAMFEWMK